ncbi:Uncharacterised protein [Cedecea neteri]|uniref:Uncharacterized protein n=1 Tax=Cedecea neteri TaxID=158822 RepID=A0A291DXU3_9ENTR|nr:hypothetical protein [Cedecea neteri]ATF92408.1 hypothetical protein CO704_10085 [Cedecea neteri]ATF92829.1 hypothetical protein CO704_12360 [Cedecea neteri]ATF93675.1 hypothetical protein CO704_16935 [Cedecea neteri]SQC92526.1 Uncharacterised protein [Cedecea neteri]SQC93416.1 Uncharacterised protein [Cedecea neteri]
MALTEEQKTDFDAPYRDGELTPVPVAKGELIPAGTIVCVNTEGFAVGGKEAVDLVWAGRAETRADNTAGNDGAISVLMRRNKAFRWRNDGTIVQAHVGKRVWVLDNRTLTGTDGGAKRSKAGTVILLESDGVWIE